MRSEELLLATAPRIVEDIPIKLILPSKLQPRLDYDHGRLDNLAKSIKKVGLIEPITIRTMPGGYFEVVCGHRRLSACRKIGKTTIPAIVVDIDDATALEMMLHENGFREDLTQDDARQGLARVKNLKRMFRFFKPQRIKKNEMSEELEF